MFYLVRYNQPKIALNATWNRCGTTLANDDTLGGLPRAIFINFNNTIYVASHVNNEFLIWTEDSTVPRRISTPLPAFTSLFVTPNGDIYFENGYDKGRIDKWIEHSPHGLFVTRFSEECIGLFIDLNDVLYCCMRDAHRVDKVSLNSGNNAPVTVAGAGYAGSATNELNGPFGIFVDHNLNLYVADSGNNRILLFRPGQSMGELKAGHGTPAGLFLNYSTSVILDADLVLYIADNNNHRIIRSKDDQFDCIIGCTGQSGSAADQLNKPYAIRFDNYGNLYVADEHNHRIQKFTLTLNFSSQNNCIDSYTTEFYSTVSNNPCTILRPCLNNGTCMNTDNNRNYSCSCMSGFYGLHCELSSRPCTSTTCSNYGKSFFCSSCLFSSSIKHCRHMQ